MAARREKGLYYNCDDKWSNTHKCKGRLLLLVAENDDGTHEDAVPPPIDLPPPEEASEVHISFNALSGSGTHTSDTLRLFGFVNRSRVTVLVDGGSTHNFVQS